MMLFFGLSVPRAAVRDVKKYGAAADGQRDATGAIKRAISTLQPGDTLLFPCGTYLTSSQLVVSVSHVTIEGSGCATIRNGSSGNESILVIGANGTSGPSFDPPVPLDNRATELATTFAASKLGVRAGDYVYIHQGGIDYSTDTPPGHAANCDVSGCRGEILRVASVQANTIKVTTALHDTYDPWMNGAVAQKLLKPVSGVTVQNITFEGTQAIQRGFGLNGVVESRVQGVTARNVQGAAVFSNGAFGVVFSNITISEAGSTACGDAWSLFMAGNITVSDLAVSHENPGMNGGCLSGGAFGMGVSTVANSTFTRVRVDASGAYGRPFKTTAARWNTFNALTVQNGATFGNGVSLEYYSSHNTFNDCLVTNNGAGTGTGTGNAGINSFGNFNQYNTFNRCTVSGNGNVQFLTGNSDALRLGQDSYVSINGGTFSGTNDREPVILIAGTNASVTGARINGPGSAGLELDFAHGCVNNNMFAGVFRSGGIAVLPSGSAIGRGNALNGNGSNLTSGLCSPVESSSRH
jgi:hypothetical protein